MPSSGQTGKVAELILSLVTTPDRAASTVGDLVEKADTKGPLWFWFSVVVTACSLCWRDFRSAPLRIIWLGFRGCFAAFFWTTAALAPIYFLVLVIRPDNPLPNSPWAWPLTIAAEIFGGLMVGWRIGKSSKGRELAAALAVTFTIAAFYALVGYWDAWQFRLNGHHLGRSIYPFAEDCLEVSFVILGAILFRFSGKRRKPSVAASPGEFKFN